jgi:hypothetical protein
MPILASQPGCARPRTTRSFFQGQTAEGAYLVGVRVCHIFISPEHNYFGHHGQAPGEAPMIEVSEVDIIAGQ